MDLADLRTQNLSRVLEWHPGFPEGDWNAGDWGNAMGGECGEAQNVIKKLHRLECNIHGRASETDWKELVEHLGEELADVIIYADLVAAVFGIDLNRAIPRKFNKTSEEHGFKQRLTYG